MSATIAEKPQELTLQEHVTARTIEKNRGDPDTPELIYNLLERIQGEGVSSITIELQFLTQVLNYDKSVKNNLKYTTLLLNILDKKYMESSDARMELLRFKMIFYGGLFPDQEKLATVTAQAEEEHARMQNRHMIAQMLYLVEMGKAYVRLSEGRPGDAQDKAREYFNQAIALNIFLPSYRPSVERLKELYLQASIELINMTDQRSELEKLWFAPFTHETLRRTFPEKSEHINRDFANPGRLLIEDTVADWLHVMIVDLSKDDAIVPHLKAVLEYILQRGN